MTSLENTFDNFELLPGTEEALSSFKSLLDGPRLMLLCIGGVGNGKTHLCEAASIELYKKGIFCRVMKMADLIRVLKNSINNSDLDYGAILSRFCCSERLILDDIGAGGSDSAYSDKILEEIVVSRYGRQLFTILTSNRELNDLPERVISRFRDGSTSYLVLNKGQDYRPRKGKL